MMFKAQLRRGNLGDSIVVVSDTEVVLIRHQTGDVFPKGCVSISGLPEGVGGDVTELFGQGTRRDGGDTSTERMTGHSQKAGLVLLDGCDDIRFHGDIGLLEAFVDLVRLTTAV